VPWGPFWGNGTDFWTKNWAATVGAMGHLFSAKFSLQEKYKDPVMETMIRLAPTVQKGTQ